VNKAAVGRKATRLAQEFKKGNLAGFELGDLYNEYPPKRTGRAGRITAESAVFTVEWWEQQTGLSARRLRECAQAARECPLEERDDQTVDKVIRERVRNLPSEEDLEEQEIRKEAQKELERATVGSVEHPEQYEQSRDEAIGRVMEMAAAGRSVEEIAEELDFDRTSFSRQTDLVDALLEVRPDAMSRILRPSVTCETLTPDEVLRNVDYEVSILFGQMYRLCEDDLKRLRMLARTIEREIKKYGN
jgi:F0F1-type ATP synthase membrane subunit b/b'